MSEIFIYFGSSILVGVIGTVLYYVKKRRNRNHQALIIYTPPKKLQKTKKKITKIKIPRNKENFIQPISDQDSSSSSSDFIIQNYKLWDGRELIIDKF